MSYKTQKIKEESNGLQYRVMKVPVTEYVGFQRTLKRDNPIKVITTDDVARAIAKKGGMYLNDVREILGYLHEFVTEQLASAVDGEDVHVKICNGIQVCGQYVPPYKAVSKTTGEQMDVNEKIRVFTYITDHFKCAVTKLMRNKNVGDITETDTITGGDNR